MTGIELPREIVKRRPRTPILVVSGFPGIEAIADDLPCLAKPFRRADLAASLDWLRRLS
jgi:hypothetical protein